MPLPTTEICKRVGAATSRLVILHPDPPHKLLSFGTGFAISPKGVILTARHVVSDGNQFYKGPIHGIANSSGAIQMYVPITAADLRLDTNTRETKPLPIDMALLQPFPPLPQECAYLPLREAILEVGEEVIVAGYAKDITYPFFIQEKLDTRTFEGMDMKAKFKQTYGLRQLLFKKTIIGVT